MLYILDAYNVIHKMHRLETALDTDLRTAREALSTLCAGVAQRRGDITSMILVFDGRSEWNDLPKKASAKIRLVFSETNEDADDRIATLLAKLPEKPEKCVVSDDNSVRNHARAYRACVMSVAEFEKLTNKTEGKNKNRKKADSSAGKPSLPPNIAKKITEAYRKDLGL